MYKVVVIFSVRSETGMIYQYNMATPSRKGGMRFAYVIFIMLNQNMLVPYGITIKGGASYYERMTVKEELEIREA